MSWRNYLLLFLVGIAVTSLVAVFQDSPGYMDADYYYAGGLRLAEGYGFTEDILWNYLDNPAGLPHPSHAYWMPFASLVAAGGMIIAGSTTFGAAKLGFLLAAGLVAPLTAGLSYEITQRKESAIFSGFLAAIPGFYLSYMGTTDVFGIYMLLGATWLLLAGRIIQSRSVRFPSIALQTFALGLVSGLFHLSRADGLMWFAVGVLVIILKGVPSRNNPVPVRADASRNIWMVLSGLLAFGSGYLLIMAPWMARNLSVFGSLLAPGGSRALWLTNYDQLFAYPPELVNPSHWWASGLGEIFRARWGALGQNIQSALAVQGEIFLVPLVLLGLWHWRQDPRVRIGMLAWCGTLFVMTVLFPYVGWRGGFFHSGAAYQPLFWAVVPAGLDGFIDWGRRARRWNVQQATQVFRAGLVGLAILLSILVVQKKVYGSSLTDRIWDDSWLSYVGVEQTLRLHGVDSSAIVLVNNAPGYYVASQRPALSIPNGGPETTLEVARRYGVEYLLLEQNHPEGLTGLYEQPEDQPGLRHWFSYEGIQVFHIER